MKKNTILIVLLCFVVSCLMISCNPYDKPVKYKAQKQGKSNVIKSNIKMKSYNKRKYQSVNANNPSY